MRRLPSAIFGILTVPAIAWLVDELFGDLLAAVIVAFIAAVSPMLVVYSQEAQASTRWWALDVVVTTALAARIARRPTRVSLIGYAVALICVGFYTHGFFIINAVTQAIWLTWCTTGRTRRNALLACAAAFIAFVPWAGRGSPTHTGTISDHQPMGRPRAIVAVVSCQARVQRGRDALRP